MSVERPEGTRPSYVGPPRTEEHSWNPWAKFAAWVVVIGVLTLLLAQIFTGCLVPIPNDLAELPSFDYLEPPRLQGPEGAVPFQGRGVPVALGAPVNPVGYTVESLDRGEAAYDVYCRLCHGGVDETSVGSVGELFDPPPPLLGDRADQLQDGQIYQAVTEGFGRMPALAWNLEDDQRWHVVNYIRSVTTGAPPEEPSGVDRSAVNYQMHCATCHGPAGRGALGPALYPSALLIEATPEDIANIILAGRTGRGMPAFSGYLSEEEAENMGLLLQRLQTEGPSLILDALERAGRTTTTTAPAPTTTTTDGAETTTTTGPPGTTTTTEADLEAAREVFAQNCAGCHGEEGIQGGVGPPLQPSEFVQNNPDEAVRQVIEEGRGAMPAWEGRLTAEQISALVTLMNAWQGDGETSDVSPPDGARRAHRAPVFVSNRMVVAQAESGEADLEAAREVFAQNCAGCHGEEGIQGGVGPPLQPSEFVQNNPDEAVRQVIEEGRGAMPAWEGRLTAEQISALVTLMNAWQGEGEPTTTAPGEPTTTAPGQATTTAVEPAEAPSAAETPEGEYEELVFSHRAHVQRDMECTFCHALARRGPVAGVPPLELCAGCHQWLTTQNERTEQVVSAFQENRPVAWDRIYAQPDFVVFNHRSHVLVAEVPCETCHGDVGEQTIIRSPAVDLNMGFCLDCHERRFHGLYEDPPAAGIEGSILEFDLPRGNFLTDCHICHM